MKILSRWPAPRNGAEVETSNLVFVGACVVLLVGVIARSVLCAAAGRLAIADESQWLVIASYFFLVSVPLSRLPFQLPTVICRFLGFAYAFKFCCGPIIEAAYYLGRSFPMADGQLAQLDQWLGFDWRASAVFFDRRPFIYPYLEWAYHSAFWQPFVLAGLLIVCGRAERLYTFLIASSLTLTVTMVVTTFVPAYGAYEHFGAAHWLHHLSFGDMNKMTAPLNAIRAGMRRPDGDDVALVQFPSFHTSMAVIYTWAAWQTIVRWPWIALNGVMLLAIPIGGSHYLVDMLAGALIASLVLVATKRSIGWIQRALGARFDPAIPSETRLPAPYSPGPTTPSIATVMLREPTSSDCLVS